MSIWSDIEDKSSGDVVRAEDFKIDIMLKKGIVHFKYKKKDKVKNGVVIKEGEVRDAWGTKKMDVISHIPHGGECPPKRVGYTTYFDVEKGDWRVFWEDNIIYIEKKIYTEEEFRTKIYPTLVGDK